MVEPHGQRHDPRVAPSSDRCNHNIEVVMLLRFTEDRRTLFYALVLFPLVPALCLARPALVPWLVPVALYASYLSGVLSHNHNHLGVFRNKRVNALYGAWLSVFYGMPLFAWIPTHNQNHHQELNGGADASRTTLAGADSLLTLLRYPFVCARHQLPLVLRYAKEAAKHHPSRFRRILLETGALLAGHLAVALAGVALHGPKLGLVVYAVSLGAPALVAPYLMMLTNYVQHVGCDPSSPDDHSRNFTSPSFNYLVLENGLHTVHHEHPGTHWSRLRSLHEAREARMDPRLNERDLFSFVAKTYLHPFRRRNSSPPPLARAAGRP
jgi:beta-carotene hydroxylase